jgi:hypothetical protein
MAGKRSLPRCAPDAYPSPPGSVFSKLVLALVVSAHPMGLWRLICSHAALDHRDGDAPEPAVHTPNFSSLEILVTGIK